MGSRYEVELTIGSARDLKNVNWRHGDLKAYAVAWIDPAAKSSTKVDVDGDTSPVWDEKLRIPLGDRSVEDAVLYIDVVHAGSGDGVKPLVGSARLPLREVADEAGKCTRSLKLKRPSGRPHGKIEVTVKIAPKESSRYYDPYAPTYPQPAGSRDFPGSGGYGQPYAAAPPAGYPYGAPPPQAAPGGYGGYGAPLPPQPAAGGYGGYGAPPPPQPAAGGYGGYGAPPGNYGYGSGYGQPEYGTSAGYGQQQQGYVTVVEEKKKSKFGMGTGLAVGAVGGILGGLALAEGVDYVEDKISNEAAEKVEDDVGYDDNGGYDDDY